MASYVYFFNEKIAVICRFFGVKKERKKEPGMDIKKGR